MRGGGIFNYRERIVMKSECELDQIMFALEWNISNRAILSISIVCFIVNSHCVLTRGGYFQGGVIVWRGLKSWQVICGQIILALEGNISNRAILSISIVCFIVINHCVLTRGGYFQGGVVAWRGLNSWQVIFGQIIYDYDDNIQTSLKHTNTMKHHSSIYSISAKTETCSHSKFH